MNQLIIKDLKEIVWKEGFIDPTEIMVRFYERKGIKFTDDDKSIFRLWKPETIFRELRNISRPSVSTKQTRLEDHLK